MADIYRKRIIVPENLPEVLTPINNNQAVIVEKDVYGSSGFRDNLDTGFSEFNKPKKQSIDKFFKDYEELFYDIPEEGKEKTHRYILETSGEYLDMFLTRDSTIESLEKQLEELEEELEECRNPEEHPFYPNGSVLSAGGGGSYYFMERGKKRNIVGGRPGSVWKALKSALGWKESDDDFEKGIVKNTPRALIAQIKSGPSLDIEDIGGGLQQEPKQIAIKLDPSDHKANPELYNDIPTYKIALEKEIIEAWDLERNMETLHYKYANDKVNSYTEEERTEAEINDAQAKFELKKARRKLAAYKMIYQSLESNQDTLIEISELYNTLTADNFEAIEDSDTRQFSGWEKGKDGLEDVVKDFWKEGERSTDNY
tara:strand:- start:134 stop:1243 length:1110 start_codon:yes stop_codon:yes gene_type:complete